MKKKEKKDVEKILKTLPPEILSTLGIVIAFVAIGILKKYAPFENRKNLTRKK